MDIIFDQIGKLWPTTITDVLNNTCVTVQLKNWCWPRSCTLRLSRGREAVLILKDSNLGETIGEAPCANSPLDRRKQLFAVWSPNALADLETDQKSFKKVISGDRNQFCVHLVGRYFFITTIKTTMPCVIVLAASLCWVNFELLWIRNTSKYCISLYI